MAGATDGDGLPRPEASGTALLFGEKPADQVGIERKAALGQLLSSVLAAPVEKVAVGRFEIRSRIGAGAMGVVYRAWDPQLEREVALKLLAGERVAHRAESIISEARLLARLTHPNVVIVHEAGEVNGEPFIAMELVEGADLDRWLNEHRTATQAEIIELFRQAGAGLAAAHRAGVVHRDFKPHNVIVGDDGRVRVVDFGLAMTRDENAPERAGTWQFMSPEQRTRGVADAKSDQYSFCVALWTALCPGSKPGDAGARMPRSVRKHLVRGLSTDPGRRWPSMEALVEALAPSKRRGAVTLGLGAFAVTLTLGAAIWMRPPATSEVPLVQVCPEPVGAFEDVWNEDARRELAADFRVEGRSEPSVLARAVEAKLQRRVAEWGEARQDACRQRQATDVETVELGSRRALCLDAAADHLRWFIGWLPSLSPEERLEVLVALETVPEASDCDDPDSLFASPQAQMDVVHEIHRGHSALALRRVDTARASLRHALDTAIDQGFERLAARAALDLSTVEFNAGDDELSAAFARDALARAERLEDLELMVFAWSRLGDVQRRRKQLDEAEFSLERQRNLARRLPEDGLAGAALAWDEASLASDRGKHAVAIEHYEQAARRFDAAGDRVSAAQVRCDSAMSLLELGRTDAAAETMGDCVARMVELKGPFHPALDYPMAQAANLALVTGDNARALDYGEKAVELWRHAQGRSPAEKAQVYALVAGAAIELGEHRRAEQLLDLALETLSEAPGPAPVSTIIVKVQYAVSLTERGRCDLAIGYYDEVVETFGDREDAPAYQMLTTHMNRAECLAKLGRHAEALEALTRGWTVSPHAPTSPTHMSALRHDGEIRRLAGDLPGARRSLERFVSEAAAAGVSEGDRAYGHFLLAQTYEASNQPDRVAAQIALAKPLFDADGAQNPERRDAFERWCAARGP